MTILTEPIGSIPRPAELVEGTRLAEAVLEKTQIAI